MKEKCEVLGVSGTAAHACSSSSVLALHACKSSAVSLSLFVLFSLESGMELLITVKKLSDSRH